MYVIYVLPYGICGSLFGYFLFFEKGGKILGRKKKPSRSHYSGLILDIMVLEFSIFSYISLC